MMASDLPSWSVNLFPISKLFTDASSVDHFALIIFRSLYETNIILSLAYEIRMNNME